MDDFALIRYEYEVLLYVWLKQQVTSYMQYAHLHQYPGDMWVSFHNIPVTGTATLLLLARALTKISNTDTKVAAMVAKGTIGYTLMTSDI